MTSPDRSSLLARSEAHLREARLGYVEHFGVAVGIGSSLVTAGAACLLHAIVPGTSPTRQAASCAGSTARSSAISARPAPPTCTSSNMRSEAGS
ncbi:DUF6356 family protein [Allosphingosinicella humi]